MRGKICKELRRITLQEAIRNEARVPVPKIYNLLKKHYKQGILQRIVKGKNVRYKHRVPVGEKSKVATATRNEKTHSLPVSKPKV